MRLEDVAHLVEIGRDLAELLHQEQDDDVPPIARQLPHRLRAPDDVEDEAIGIQEELEHLQDADPVGQEDIGERVDIIRQIDLDGIMRVAAQEISELAVHAHSGESPNLGAAGARHMRSLQLPCWRRGSPKAMALRS